MPCTRTRLAPSLLLVVLLAACGPKPTAPGGGSGAPDSEPIQVAGIGFQDDQFFRLVEAGMKAEAGKRKVRFSGGSSAGSLEKEISLIETYTARRVDAIAVAPLSARASVPALERAHTAGVRIVTFDSPLAAGFPESSIRSDQAALGRSTGEMAHRYIQQHLQGRAKVAILTYMSLAPEPASERTRGFKQQVERLPGVKVVATQDAWLAAQATTVAESILAAHPDLDLIWAANEGGTVGAVTAVRNTGRAGKVVVFGTDISDQIAGFLLAGDGILQAVTGQKPFEIGSMAVEMAVRSVNGEKVDKQVLLPGMLFSRDQPESVREFQEYLRSLGK